MKESLKHFNASVKTEEDFKNINIALDNYIQELKEKETPLQYIKNGSTWFNNWRDYLSQNTDVGCLKQKEAIDFFKNAFN